MGRIRLLTRLLLCTRACHSRKFVSYRSLPKVKCYDAKGLNIRWPHVWAVQLQPAVLDSFMSVRLLAVRATRSYNIPTFQHLDVHILFVFLMVITIMHCIQIIFHQQQMYLRCCFQTDDKSFYKAENSCRTADVGLKTWTMANCYDWVVR